MKLVFLAVIILALAVAGIAIKLLIKKDGEFKKTCSSIDAKTGKPADCVCGGPDEDPSKCQNFKKHHGKEAENL